MKYVKDFYEITAMCQETVGNTLLTIGNPSKSFLAAVQTSPLFENEKTIFTERFP